MDWQQCLGKRLAKQVWEDVGKAESFLEIIHSKIESAESLDKKYYYAKITLFYDALRTLLELKALRKGYKIYNHECYSAFLAEICNMSSEAEKFDEINKIMNGINYYGQTLTEQEADAVIFKIKRLTGKAKL